jgi:hypothetical protein
MELPAGPLDELAALADGVARDLDLSTVAVSVWDRGAEELVTLVNVGVLGRGEVPRPGAERYPVASFPALATLLVKERPYRFGPGDVTDVSSASLAASLGKESQAAVPLYCGGRVWGELWAATVAGKHPPLEPAAVPALAAAAGRLSAAVERHLADGWSPTAGERSAV